MRKLAIFSLFLGCVVSVPLSVNVDSNVQYPGVDYSQSVEVYPKNSSFICEDNDGEKGVCTCASICARMEGRSGGQTCEGKSAGGTLCAPYDAPVCCKYEASCGSRVSQSIVYFQNPNYPLAVKKEMSCNLDLLVRHNVRQLRVDFVKFELPSPDATGRCERTNRLSVYAPQAPLGILGSGADSLCGRNTDNHFYIPVSQGDNVQFLFTLSGGKNVPLYPSSQSNPSVNSDTDVLWNLMITQVESFSTDPIMKSFDAPIGCKQYFGTDGEDGHIKSFNFDGTSVIAPNQDYTICFAGFGGLRRTCSVTLTPITFGMPVNTATEINEGKSVEGGDCLFTQNAVVASAECCTNSYSSFLSVFGKVHKPDGTDYEDILRSKYCGTAKAAPTAAEPSVGGGPVTTTKDPVIIRIRTGPWPKTLTNAIPGGVEGKIGFNIEYKFNSGMC